MGGSQTSVVPLLTVTMMMAVVASVCAAQNVTEDGRVVLSLDEDFTEDTKNRIRVSSPIFPGDMESYAAYLTVNDTVDINLFFWLCMAKRERRGRAPLLLWLNGGPTVPSVVGALLENGPYQLHEDGTVSERPHAWTNEFHMLYVDNPVGTGYSYSSQNFMEENMDGVVQSLYKLLRYMNTTMCPECFQNGLYIGGKSYAGKYVPSLGSRIHHENQQQSVEGRRIPLKGVYIGAGLCDPQTMLPLHFDTLYYAGLISRQSRDELRSTVVDFLSRPFDSQNMSVLFAVADNATADGRLDSLLAPEVSLSSRIATLEKWMNWETTRRALHVGNASGSSYAEFSLEVSVKLMTNDFTVDTVEENALLMDNYKVMHYSGNLDMLVSAAMTDAFLDRVEWAGRDTLRSRVYSKWMLNKEMLGWYTTVRNFTRVIVRNAGHSLYSQPVSALEMMKSFVHDQPPFRVPQGVDGGESSGADLPHSGLLCRSAVLAALLCLFLC